MENFIWLQLVINESNVWYDLNLQLIRFETNLFFSWLICPNYIFNFFQLLPFLYNCYNILILGACSILNLETFSFKYQARRNWGEIGVELGRVSKILSSFLSKQYFQQLILNLHTSLSVWVERLCRGQYHGFDELDILKESGLAVHPSDPPLTGLVRIYFQRD